jgi:hypothetical protein
MPTTTSSPTSKPSSGLSSGAKAGIGIGAAIAGLAIIGVVGLLFFRRHRASTAKDRIQHPSDTYMEEHPEAAAVQYINEPKELEAPPKIYELSGHEPPASEPGISPER